jgi:hypothetical protein
MPILTARGSEFAVQVSPEVVGRLRAPSFLILGLLCVQPIAEILVASWPLRPGIGGWRMSTLSAASGSLLLSLLGLFLIYWLELSGGHRRIILTVAWIASGAVLFCLAGAVEFGLDALQMRSQVDPDAAGRYQIASAWVLAKLLLSGVAGLVLARSAFRTARLLRREHKRPPAKTTPVIVGEKFAEGDEEKAL